jgi:hypothetical protein
MVSTSADTGRYLQMIDETSTFAPVSSSDPSSATNQVANLAADEVAEGMVNEAIEALDPGPVTVEEKSALLDEFSDRLAAFRTLTHGDDQAATDQILGEFGAHGKVERDIVHEISARRPLWMPDRFEEAHRLVMRSLEVLDRNGARPVKTPKLGPLTPLAAWLVQLVARFIVRNHQAEVITSIKNLYIRREANAAPNIPERFMLRRARIDSERMLPTLKKNPLGVPTFLLGGAVLSSVTSALGNAIKSAQTKIGLIIASVVLFALLALITWAVLRGAAVARQRIKLSLDRPLNALWETIGACGKPPKDSAKAFALIATIVTVVSFLILPLGIGLAFFRDDKPVKSNVKMEKETTVTVTKTVERPVGR